MNDLDLCDHGTVEAIIRPVGQVEARRANAIRRGMQALLDLQIADMLKCSISTLVCRSRETSELVSCMKHVVADEEVEDQRPDYTDPNKKVIGVYSDFIPPVVDPAPDL